MIGAFHQPQCVVADSALLATLPEREYAAGLAEVIKYGLINDLDFLHWLDHQSSAILAQDPAAIEHLVAASCRNKADIVARDETEQDIRAWLNLGHTFGHAIEAYQHYQGLLHGEAVAIGMVMALDFSASLGWLSPADASYGKTVIEKFQLPVCPPIDMQADDFISFMQRDKKVLNQQLRLVLLQALGQAVVTADYPATALSQFLEDYCAQSTQV